MVWAPSSYGRTAILWFRQNLDVTDPYPPPHTEGLQRPFGPNIVYTNGTFQFGLMPKQETKGGGGLHTAVASALLLVSGVMASFSDGTPSMCEAMMRDAIWQRYPASCASSKQKQQEIKVLFLCGIFTSRIHVVLLTTPTGTGKAEGEFAAAEHHPASCAALRELPWTGRWAACLPRRRLTCSDKCFRSIRVGFLKPKWALLRCLSCVDEKLDSTQATKQKQTTSSTLKKKELSWEEVDCRGLEHSIVFGQVFNIRVSLTWFVFSPSANVSQIGLMESCTCCRGGPPPPPLAWWQRDGWLGRSAFTLIKRTCSISCSLCVHMSECLITALHGVRESTEEDVNRFYEDILETITVSCCFPEQIGAQGGTPLERQTWADPCLERFPSTASFCGKKKILFWKRRQQPLAQIGEG